MGIQLLEDIRYKKLLMLFLDTKLIWLKHWILNVEGYYKWFTQLTNINRNKLYDDDDDVPDVLKKDFIIETGDAYGVDFVLKYNTENLPMGSLATFGKVTRWDGTNAYAPLFDRRHNVNLIGTKKFGEKIHGK